MFVPLKHPWLYYYKQLINYIELNLPAPLNISIGVFVIYLIKLSCITILVNSDLVPLIFK